MIPARLCYSWWGTSPQKRLFVGYFTPQAYCPLWGVKPVRFCFSAPSIGVQDFHLKPRALPCSHFGLTPLSHIGWRCAPLMVYKPLERPWVYYYSAHCRGKGPRAYNGPWVPYENSTTSEEKAWVPKGLPAQFLWAWRCLKGGPRKNVSSNVPNMAQTCTLPVKRIHPYKH